MLKLMPILSYRCIVSLSEHLQKVRRLLFVKFWKDRLRMVLNLTQLHVQQ